MFEVLVLGATGFIGGHIAKAALKEGWTVRGFRRRAGRTGHLAGEEIDWRLGDLMDHNSLVQAMQGVDFVFHAAAYYPQSAKGKSYDEHLNTAKKEIGNVLSAAHAGDIRRLVYTSSLSTIGRPPEDEDRLADERDVYQPGTLPENAYYDVKSVMERAVLTGVEKGLNAVIVNPTTVFGPGDVHLTTGRILVAVAQGKVIASPPGAVNVVDVRDVAQGHVAAARQGYTGERYILGGHNYLIRDMLGIMAQLSGARAPFFTIPKELLRLLTQMGDAIPFLHLPDHLQAYPYWQGYNTQKAVEEFDLSPRPFQETIRDSIKWFEDHGML